MFRRFGLASLASLAELASWEGCLGPEPAAGPVLGGEAGDMG